MLDSAGGSAARSIFDMYYALSSETPPGAMNLEKGTLIENCDQVFPDFWEKCLTGRGNVDQFPAFSGNAYYYYTSTVIWPDTATLDACAACVYENKIYVLAYG